jgi:hypothetical protein
MATKQALKEKPKEKSTNIRQHTNHHGRHNLAGQKKVLRQKAEDKTLSKESAKLQGASCLPTTEKEK